MAVIEKTRRATWVAFGLLAATTFVACGVDNERADGPARSTADPTSVTGMLSLAPDTAVNRRQIWVSLWSKAEAAVELDIDPELAGDEREIRRLFLLTNDLETGTGIGGSEVVSPSDKGKIGSLGFLPSAVDADITAGLPPDQFDVVVGDIDAADVIDRAGEIDGATRTEVSGTEVVRWFDDYQSRPRSKTPFGRVPLSGRVTATDGVVAHDRSDAGMAAYIDGVEGDGSTLDQVDELAAVAEALDEAEVHAAYLSTDMRSQGGVLAPYAALGVGAALVDGAPQTVIVVAHASEDAARASKRGLTDILENRPDDGEAPWSPSVSDFDVTRRGTVTVARLTTSRATLWSELVIGNEALLASS